MLVLVLVLVLVLALVPALVLVKVQVLMVLQQLELSAHRPALVLGASMSLVHIRRAVL